MEGYFHFLKKRGGKGESKKHTAIAVPINRVRAQDWLGVGEAEERIRHFKEKLYWTPAPKLLKNEKAIEESVA